MSDPKFPKPEEFQKELEEFVQKRLGDQIKVVTSHGPAMPPKEDGAKEKKGFTPPLNVNDAIESFSYKPKDLKEYLDRFIIEQDDAKKALSIAICDHYNFVREDHLRKSQYKGKNKGLKDPAPFVYSKQNVMILGPTGVGKTYMIKQIAELIGVPFVKADATRFSETGYMGANVDDLIRDLVAQADGDINQAQYGIVYIDEVDKLAKAAGHSGRDVSGRGVQLGLLKLMEETEVDLKSANDPASQIQAFMELQQKGRVEKQVVNTRYILFIVSGAFVGLDALISKRIHSNSIGFQQAAPRVSKKYEKYDLLKSASTKDFIDFGLEPEFIGRLPVRVACHELDEKSLEAILNASEGSILKQYIQSFAAYGVKLQFSKDAIAEISKKAFLEQTGARGLFTVCEKLLREFKYELPSMDVETFTVDKDSFENQASIIEELGRKSSAIPEAVQEDIKAFIKKFHDQHKMKMVFDPSAVRKIYQLSEQKNKSVTEICHEVFNAYEHGLKLIHLNNGQDLFLISERTIDFPKEELERMVKDSYARVGACL